MEFQYALTKRKDYVINCHCLAVCVRQYYCLMIDEYSILCIRNEKKNPRWPSQNAYIICLFTINWSLSRYSHCFSAYKAHFMCGFQWTNIINWTCLPANYCGACVASNMLSAKVSNAKIGISVQISLCSRVLAYASSTWLRVCCVFFIVFRESTSFSLESRVHSSPTFEEAFFICLENPVSQ